MPKITDASRVETGKNYVKVDGQKIDKWWGKTLYYIDSDQNLRYRNFSLPGRILQCFGYKSKYNSQDIHTWLKSKKVVHQSHVSAVDDKAAKALEAKKLQFNELCSEYDCIINDNIDEIMELFKDGFDVNTILDKNNTTPLHVASKYGCSLLVEELIDNGADIKAKSTEPGAVAVTALQFAIIVDDPNIVDFIADKSKADEKNSFGDAALHIAIDNGGQPHNLTIVEILVRDCPAHVNVTNAMGQTALHLACMKGDLETVKVLYKPQTPLINSLDPSIQDNNGQTACDIAVSKGFKEIEEYLKNPG